MLRRSCSSSSLARCRALVLQASSSSAEATGSTRSLAAAAPAPGSPTAAAHAAIKSPADSSGNGGGGGPSGGDGGEGGGGGGGWFLPVLTLAAAGGGGYYYYNSTTQPGAAATNSSGLPQLPQVLSREQLDATQKAAFDLLNKSKQKVQELLPPMLGGTGKQQQQQPAKQPSKSSHSVDRLAEQLRRDAEEAGFKMLPPGSEDAAAAAAAADAAAAASAAARDSLSAAADEFPGSTAGATTQQQQGAAVVLEDLLSSTGGPEHMDLSPIADLFADATGVHAATATSTSSSSKAPTDDDAAHNLAEGLHKMQSSAASALGAAGAAANKAAAALSHGAPAAAKVPSEAGAPLPEVQDSELDRLCAKLGLSKDLAPSGLVAAANKAGLGAADESTQTAQLNQATADARILDEVLQLAAASTAQLRQELEQARQQAAWSEQAAEKREASLTQHFKELMREQSRIHQELAEAAVKEAQQVVIADTSKAHLQERRERLALIDGLRDKVNALAVAFDQRTAQLRSVQDVNRVSMGMLSLSKALEEGAPIGPQLQQLAASCPDDPLVEAVAASLPPSAASQGLPTMQELRERFADVAQAAAEAAYFTGQGAQGGVLAHLAAKLAAKLKVDAGADVDNSVDSKLSQARKLLQQGQLRAAAETLASAAEGTQAAAAVQQWVADAQARAAADQAVKVLQAHATATAGLTS